MDTTQTLRRSAALLMAGAAVIHIGLTHAHFEEWWAAGTFFLVSSVLQTAWAVAAGTRPLGRRLLAAGQALNVALIGVWLLSRTTGLPIGPERWTAEPVGAADIVCVVFEAACIAAVAVLRVRERRNPQWAPAGVAPTASHAAPGLRHTTRGGLVTAAVAAGVVAASGVALAAPGHDDAPMTADGSTQAAGQDHTDADQAGAMAMGAPGNGERHDIPNLPDDSTATDAQKAAARQLLVSTETDTAAYRDLARAKAAGFDVEAAWARKQALATTRGRPAAKAEVGQVHVPNKANRTDGRILDPTAPETLIYARAKDGTFTLVGVMYTAEKKAPPTTYQPYVRWHYHEACIDPGAAKGVKVTKLGHGQTCPSGTTTRRSGYMTHVWFVDPADLVHAFAMDPPRAALKAYAAKVT